MRPVTTDGVACSVGLSVTTANPAETAEPIEIPFGCGLRWVKGTVLDGDVDPHGKGHF